MVSKKLIAKAVVGEVAAVKGLKGVAKKKGRGHAGVLKKIAKSLKKGGRHGDTAKQLMGAHDNPFGAMRPASEMAKHLGSRSMNSRLHPRLSVKSPAPIRGSTRPLVLKKRPAGMQPR